MKSRRSKVRPVPPGERDAVTVRVLMGTADPGERRRAEAELAESIRAERGWVERAGRGFFGGGGPTP